LLALFIEDLVLQRGWRRKDVLQSKRKKDETEKKEILINFTLKRVNQWGGRKRAHDRILMW